VDLLISHFLPFMGICGCRGNQIYKPSLLLVTFCRNRLALVSFFQLEKHLQNRNNFLGSAACKLWNCEQNLTTHKLIICEECPGFNRMILINLKKWASVSFSICWCWTPESSYSEGCTKFLVSFVGLLSSQNIDLRSLCFKFIFKRNIKNQL
jgi:hypothetical protein